MPTNDPYDVNEIARLLSEGKSMTEIATALDGPQVDPAAAQRQSLQAQRGALHAESAPPGQEPVEDPVEGMFAAARRSGSPRGSQGYIDAGLERLFEAAQAGDERVVTEGTVDRETAERWHRDAVQRQVANRERSGFSRPH
jgi:hypothetical protein